MTTPPPSFCPRLCPPSKTFFYLPTLWLSCVPIFTTYPSITRGTPRGVGGWLVVIPYVLSYRWAETLTANIDPYSLSLEWVKLPSYLSL
jgi:hypothetical protein